MTQVSYPYKRLRNRRYVFVSVGNKRIEKIVDFTSLGGYMVNLGFGDLLPDGTIDDKANSNNGDLVKVLATVVDILKHFTMQYPGVRIYFRGSTPERTRLYGRILRTYYPIFRKEFILYGVSRFKDEVQIFAFDPSANVKYHAFIIKRIS